MEQMRNMAGTSRIQDDVSIDVDLQELTEDELEELEVDEETHWLEVAKAMDALGKRLMHQGFSRARLLKYMEEAFLSESRFPSKDDDDLIEPVRGYIFAGGFSTDDVFSVLREQQARKQKVREYLFNYYEGVQSVLYPPQKPKVLTGGPFDRISTYVAGGLAAAIGMGAAFGNFLENRFSADTARESAISQPINGHKQVENSRADQVESQFRKKADILERKNPVEDFKEIQQGSFTFESGKGDFFRQISRFAYEHAPKGNHARIDQVMKEFQIGQYAAFMRAFGAKTPRELDAILNRAPGDPQRVLLKKVISLIGEPDTWSRTVAETVTEGGVTRTQRVRYEVKYQEQLKEFDEVRYALGHVYLQDVPKIGTDKDLNLIVGTVKPGTKLMTVAADEKSEDFIGFMKKIVTACGEENLFIAAPAPKKEALNTHTSWHPEGKTGQVLELKKGASEKASAVGYGKSFDTSFDDSFENAFASTFSETPLVHGPDRIIEEKLKKSELNGRIEHWTQKTWGTPSGSEIRKSTQKEITLEEIDEGWDGLSMAA